ncbi:hypothetical protein L6452_20940 [Arctium lappa]|uniref:Uncharacterized protein n=1 Tax=Arctium lappa TaxID=4217 RepID=A0ACB9BEN2_ARCLA|nr:hypothetical protein L6452_20940 [Arctium lappa]
MPAKHLLILAANILNIHDVPNIWHVPLRMEVKSVVDPCEDDNVNLGDDSMQRDENSEADSEKLEYKFDGVKKETDGRFMLSKKSPHRNREDHMHSIICSCALAMNLIIVSKLQSMLGVEANQTTVTEAN